MSWKRVVELLPIPASGSVVSDAARQSCVDTVLGQQHNYTGMSLVCRHRRWISKTRSTALNVKDVGYKATST